MTGGGGGGGGESDEEGKSEQVKPSDCLRTAVWIWDLAGG